MPFSVRLALRGSAFGGLHSSRLAEGGVHDRSRDQGSQTVVTATDRSRPRVVPSRSTSWSRALRGTRPASPNHATWTVSASSVHVPETTPCATTTGAIQPLCLLTSARRDFGVTCPSAVPGPRTY